mmetsp:Transcript_28477/g.47830  ORF Transcript_28477/g.47830 Transcript_28477/m.47830 type:complete len:300 (+) Transcript_28477:103-1002(+)|eukprot:CAMPEP_0198197554 /NCGR_PEP_ID=MMETSP1445-20131203/1132_1 /TAXON_ID=36898 /ORGANISM="Pyramimonas sp., Strain CCMP2087" /LENGTH=299 /DNA_ID=CAMNT_0043866867 /DNA_START=63 /DNA_END=962 /DNA_ORIENTATION=+
MAFLSKGCVAVITGSSSGIGLAIAKGCAQRGMRVVLADVDEAGLLEASSAVSALCAGGADDVLAVVTDVSKIEAVEELKAKTYEKFGKTDLLVNNAGTGGGGTPYEKLNEWHTTLNVNLFGVVNGVQTFTQAMLDQGTPAAIVNVGSKQGITCPPGNTAYNVSKAGVKILTEGLQHELRGKPDCQLSAFLLIPGWVNTQIMYKNRQRLEGEAFDPSKVFFHEDKPASGAWMPSQVSDRLFEALEAGAPFYIVCPDHEMSNEKFKAGVQWSAEDVTKDRVPLSRWSETHKAEYAALVEGL